VRECQAPDGGASGTPLRFVSSQLAETVLSGPFVLVSDRPVRSGPSGNSAPGTRSTNHGSTPAGNKRRHLCNRREISIWLE
jgi:hypothetical protein